ncbi:hypothetical protein C0J52_02644 [Blattella germanica]|nr:hypothetical protein C0J52_02644 [Blattella germanica]
MKEERAWKFRVRTSAILRESVFVLGNCPELGNWKSAGAVQLTSERDSDAEGESVWSGVVNITSKHDILFRYFVGILVEPEDENSSKHIVVRRWETNLNPRIIKKSAASNSDQEAEPDVFGWYDGSRMVDRGCLTTETVVQIKLFGDAIQLWKRKLEGKKVFVKLTPLVLNRRRQAEFTPYETLEESMDTQDVAERPDMWPITEVAVMNEKECEFHLQEQFGRQFDSDDTVVFSVSMHYPEAVAYMMDYYVFGARAMENEPPYHAGFSYVLPSMLTTSEGQVVVPITSSTHRPVGQLRLDYLVVKPIAGYKCDMSVSYSRVWKNTWQGLDVGHRGLGTSFKLELAECAEVRENTIASLKNAASAGADLVEFDIQLTKDLIPVLYHDFHVCIAMKRKKQLAEHDLLELPLKDLSLEQLQLLKKANPFTRGTSCFLDVLLLFVGFVLCSSVSVKCFRCAGEYMGKRVIEPCIPRGNADRGRLKLKKRFSFCDAATLIPQGVTPLSRVLCFCDCDPDMMHCCRGVYHLAEREGKKERVFGEESEEHQPFPTLRQALDSLDPHVGFNVEIKWTMQLKVRQCSDSFNVFPLPDWNVLKTPSRLLQDGTYELYHPFDLNLYLDVVLKVVLEHAGTRKIVFSCFHPDICTMLRLKQNRYPVIFLTQGVTKKYPDYRDPRTQSIPMAIHHAKCAEILGINAHTEDILRDSSQVKKVRDAGLVLFCWGDDNNNPATIKHLKELGVHGVIYDKIDVYSSKEVKESIFLAEAREMQRMLKTAEEMHGTQQPLLAPIHPSAQNFEIDDAENAKMLVNASATSILSSWQVSPITSGINNVSENSFGKGDAKASSFTLF